MLVHRPISTQNAVLIQSPLSQQSLPALPVFFRRLPAEWRPVQDFSVEWGLPAWDKGINLFELFRRQLPVRSSGVGVHLGRFCGAGND